MRTLPPTTAALSDGARNDLGGMRTSIGLRQPWFKGMSSEIRQRRQYIMAEYVTASGALIFPEATVRHTNEKNKSTNGIQNKP